MTRSPEQIRDELLVLQSQDGDVAALESLVDRWQRRLLNHAWRMTGSREAAGDVLQDAWLAIVRGIRRLEDPACFRQWAYRIVTNKAVDWTRRRQTNRRLLRDAAVQREAMQTDRAPELPDDEIARLRSALRELSRDRRAILSMMYLEGMSIREIAHVLSLPVGTVKSRLYHARSHLREAVERRRS